MPNAKFCKVGPSLWGSVGRTLEQDACDGRDSATRFCASAASGLTRASSKLNTTISTPSPTMELYVFGHNEDAITQVSEDREKHHLFYDPEIDALRAKEINIVWSSWCDLVVAYRHDWRQKYWTFKYLGTGLTEGQRNVLEKEYAEMPKDHDREPNINMFGTAMHDGLRGYLIHDLANETTRVMAFATELEVEAGVPEHKRHVLPPSKTVTCIKKDNDGGALVTTVSTGETEGKVIHFEKLADLWDNSLDLAESSEVIANFNPTWWCTNATTATALDGESRVYTATRDPRYPICLGRKPNRTPPMTDFRLIPHLRKVNHWSVDSGGYMSAAISCDNKLFLWGKSPPGSSRELDVLTGIADPMAPRRTGIFAEGKQDEYVKCLTARIDGKEVAVMRVAIGHGHILVEAMRLHGESDRNMALFAAGDNSKGQLGLDRSKTFVPEFEEVPGFRGTKLRQLVAAGWTSYVVAFRRYGDEDGEDTDDSVSSWPDLADAKSARSDSE